jgi:hypothetical protein
MKTKVKITLAVEPSPALFYDAGASLLGRSACPLFARNSVAHKEPPQRCDAGAHPVPGQHQAQLVQRAVRPVVDGSVDACAMVLRSWQRGGHRLAAWQSVYHADALTAASGSRLPSLPRTILPHPGTTCRSRRRQPPAAADHVTAQAPCPPASLLAGAVSQETAPVRIHPDLDRTRSVLELGSNPDLDQSPDGRRKR